MGTLYSSLGNDVDRDGVLSLWIYSSVFEERK